jgi:hypothetical protein
VKRSKPELMTLDEATRIEAQAASGALDQSLPGTQAIIDEAHRVHVAALMWGATRGDPYRRRTRRGLALGFAMVLATVGGFCVPFFAH